jgi:hypothetical protein
MRSRWAQVALTFTLVLAPLGFVQAGTLKGTVKNATTGKPAGGVAVALIQLQSGMQEVANGKSDAQGQFTFDNPGVGAQPMLVRAVYRGVNFNQALPPGRTEIEVQVFEPTQDPGAVAVASRVVIFQPNGANLLVGEEYSIQNKTQPPQAFFRADGNFEIAVPEKAELQQVAAWGPAGMPVVQATIDRGHDRYAIAFAFRPGENGARLSYLLPYPGNSATVKIPTTYPGARLLIVAPPGVQISADGLQPAGQEQGMNVYTHDALAAKATLAVSISGTAPPPSAAGGGDSGQQAQDMQQGGGAAASANIQAIPGRLDIVKWPLIVGFAGLFAIGAILLTRRPVVAVAGGAPAEDLLSSKPSYVQASPSRAPAAEPAPTTLAALDAQVSVSLDSLKDTIFRLELRRQAGTISEEEYAQERARAEKLLRDLVRG